MSKLNLSEIRNAFVTKKASVKAETKVARPQREIDAALRDMVAPALESAFVGVLHDLLTGIRDGNPMIVEADGARWEIGRGDIGRMNRVQQNALFGAAMERSESADLENLAILESALFPDESESDESTEESNSDESTEEPRRRRA
jgi:hypothetical protein